MLLGHAGGGHVLASGTLRAAGRRRRRLLQGAVELPRNATDARDTARVLDVRGRVAGLARGRARGLGCAAAERTRRTGVRERADAADADVRRETLGSIGTDPNDLRRGQGAAIGHGRGCLLASERRRRARAEGGARRIVLLGAAGRRTGGGPCPVDLSRALRGFGGRARGGSLACPLGQRRQAASARRAEGHQAHDRRPSPGPRPHREHPLVRGRHHPASHRRFRIAKISRRDCAARSHRRHAQSSPEGSLPIRRR